jgi:hypothetical protein
VHLLQSLNASRGWLDSIQFISSKTNQIERKKKQNLEHESWPLNNSILNSHVRRELKAKRGELAAVLSRQRKVARRVTIRRLRGVILDRS